MKKFLVLLCIIGILLVGWGVLFLIRPFIIDSLEKKTGLDIFLSRISFQGLSTLDLSEIRLSDPGRGHFSADGVTVDFRWKPLFSKILEIEEITLEEGELEISDAVLLKGRPAIRLHSLYGSAQGFSYPFRDQESPVVLQALVGEETSPSFGVLRVEGWINSKREDVRLAVELREIDLRQWKPYLSKSFSMNLVGGRMDFDGDLQIQAKQLWGAGVIHLRGLVLRPSSKAALVESVLGISQQQFIEFLQNSDGELVFPVKVSGRLDDPKFELGELVTSSVRQNLGRTLQKGVGRMFGIGSELGIKDLEDRAKKAVKEIEKTLRLDWLLVGPPPETEAPEESPQTSPEFTPQSLLELLITPQESR